MEDQTRSGPMGGGSAMGEGPNPTTSSREASAAFSPSSDGLGLATTTDVGEPAAPVGMRQQARDSIRDARERLKTQTREQVDQAKQGADRMVMERKRTLTDTVSALTAAFDAAASSLSDEGQPRLAEWTRELSGRARRMATYLDESDTRGLVNDLEGTARENPTAFVGTSFAAGLAAGRFLRASASDPSNGVADMSELDDRASELDFEFEADAALLGETTTDVFGASAPGHEPTGFGDGNGRPRTEGGL